jgi:8-oxo-dGTP pyrophosphatase MutT (NUDIX family)
MAKSTSRKRRLVLRLLTIVLTATGFTSVSRAWVNRPYAPSDLRTKRSFLSMPTGWQEASLRCNCLDATLAGNYVIQMIREADASTEKTVWSLYPIQAVVDTNQTSKKVGNDGSISALKVISNAEKTLSIDPHTVLTCYQLEHGHLELQCSLESPDHDDDLIPILQLLQAQWVCSLQRYQSSRHQSDDNWRISIGENREIFLGSLTGQNGLEQLFSDVLDIDAFSTTIEWVEMMTGSGQIIGNLPRFLVQKHNLLHRGIGAFVTKDRPIDLSSLTSVEDLPELYVHRRATNKSIFPSLYDMFVGGVSTTGEPSELTAQREVAEELGLTQATSTTLSQWSYGAPILTCLVCTSYNRCLVDLYQYVMDTGKETISWQEEEVSWGNFVPYQIVRAAADLSMQRAKEEGTWPGTYLPMQSDQIGIIPEDLQNTKHQGWELWNFVPDGLLVWNAWLDYVNTRVDKRTAVSR